MEKYFVIFLCLLSIATINADLSDVPKSRARGHYETSTRTIPNSRRHYDDLSEDLLEPGFRATNDNSYYRNRQGITNLDDLRDKTGCARKFGARCTCGTIPGTYDRTKRIFVVNCTNTGFTDATVLQSLPEETEHLIFSGNKLSVLPTNIFGLEKNFSKLTVIDFSNNEIEEIKGKTFHRVSSVEMLILDNNKIKSTDIEQHPRILSNFENLQTLSLRNAFAKNEWLLDDLARVFIASNLTKLIKLHLEQNQIAYVSNISIFCDLPELMDLHLASNLFSDLSLNVSCFKKLRYLDLSYNKIRKINEESGLWKILNALITEKPLPHYLRVELFGNPFNCDCFLDPFIKWVRNWTIVNADEIPHGESLSCDTGIPVTNAGLRLLEVRNTSCPIVSTSSVSYSSAITTTVIWLLCICGVVAISLFLYSHRTTIFTRMTPLLHQSTTQGVKYTTIEKEETEIAHV